MLFIPQAPVDPLVNTFPVDPGYMVCMMPPKTSFDNNQLMRHVVLPASGTNANANPKTNMNMGVNAGYDFSGLGGLGTSTPRGPTKALTIRNPKTGEVVGHVGNQASAPKEASTEDDASAEANSSGRESQDDLPRKESSKEPTKDSVISARRAFLERSDLPNILLSAAAKSGGGTAAKVMAKRQGGLWCTDRSTFTALNIDVIRRRPTGASAAAAKGLGAVGGGLSGTAREFAIGRPLPLSLRQEAKGEFSRDQLLSYRFDPVVAFPPSEVLNFRARAPIMRSSPPPTPTMCSISPLTPSSCPRKSPQLGAVTPRSPLQERNSDLENRQHRRASRAASSESLPTPSPKAYRPTGSATPKPRHEELRRLAQSLLNKICPESVQTIGEKLREVPVHNAQELELLISLISKKALSEPHYIETYADLVFTLKAAFPQFPSENGGKPVTFKSVLLNICQGEFETLPTTLEPSAEDLEQMSADEIEFQRKQTKGRLLANMKFIGHLFLRQLLSAKVVSSVIQELTLCDRADELPQEHVIECAVELILSIGYTLESMPTGSQALGQVCGRLMDLMKRILPDGRPAYSKRIQFAIQDLLDVKAASWVRKTFKAAAKTKEEIRLDQHRDLTAQARGSDVAVSEQVVLGQRPQYIHAAMEERAS